MVSRLLQKEVEALALVAGFSVANAKILAAISMVEAPYSEAGKSYSDFAMIGDQALANAKWGFSYGGLQVRSLRADTGTGRTRDAERLPEPEFNVRSSFAIWKEFEAARPGTGFKAWSTYNTGQYKALMQEVFPPPVGVYIVMPGDTLSAIAARLKVGAWQDLARVNAIRAPYTIFIGQALLLPWFEYTVKSGDTLSRIVADYGQGVTVPQVADFNQIVDANKITPGQVIRIPRSTL